MKLQLLLEREPIDEIIERTLSTYWSRRYGTPVEVNWIPRGSQSLGISSDRGDWIVNAVLNVAFPPAASLQQLESVRREFSFSVHRWRQPLQALYVHLALNPRSARWFRCANLCVTPPLPDGVDWVLIPGNQKLRLLNAKRSECVVLAKAGFAPDFLEREVSAIAQARALGIPAPPVVDSNVTEGWYIEPLILGTPVNRVRDTVKRQSATRLAVEQIRKLPLSDFVIVDAGEYAESLRASIRQIVIDAELDVRFRLTPLPRILDALIGDLDDRHAISAKIPCGTTHGDFQPANMLIEGNSLWIIDWELTQMRQAAYDLLVLALAARTPRGLAERMRNWQQRAVLDGDVDLGWHQFPEYDWADSTKRQFYLRLFLLEELQWRLQQLAPRLIQRSNGGLELFLNESLKWLQVCGRLRKEPIQTA